MAARYEEGGNWMNLTDLRSHALLRWWFAVALFVALIIAALVSTPTGQAFVGKAQVAADYVYYVYMALIWQH